MKSNQMSGWFFLVAVTFMIMRVPVLPGQDVPNQNEAVAAGAPVSFWKDVYPILEQNCFRCHSERKQLGGFRADERGSYFKSGSAALIIPGKSNQSALVEIISGKRMNMRSASSHVLSENEISIISGWIDEGAVWPDK
jgi:mono/diheme cytochrome c family protein